MNVVRYKKLLTTINSLKETYSISILQRQLSKGITEAPFGGRSRFKKDAKKEENGYNKVSARK